MYHDTVHQTESKHDSDSKLVHSDKKEEYNTKTELTVKDNQDLK